MSDVALGVKVFSRAERLKHLLESADDAPIDTVHIADDGERDSEKDRLYGTEYNFEQNLIDLEYDAGVGTGRRRLVTEVDDDYLLVVDSDHEVPDNVMVLRDQLEARPDLGGISGLLYEHGQIKGVCHDLYENGDVLVRDVRERKPVQMVAGAPLIEFDFLPFITMFRRECLEEYAWDPAYTIGKAHLDLYVGHKRLTDWNFAVSPTVLFPHHPGGDSNYVENRYSMQKLTEAKEYFLKKWGYRQLVVGQVDWRSSADPEYTPGNAVETAVKTALLNSPSTVQAAAMDARDAVRKLRSRPPM